MGVGKSTIARAFSAKTGIYCLDTDDWIESYENRNIKTIFEEDGEAYFRKCESSTAKWLSKNVKNTIIATGGGFFMAEGFEEIGTVVYLKSSFKSILKQLSKNPSSKGELAKRPLFQNETEAKDLYENRSFMYEKKAEIVLSVENRPIKEIVDSLIRSLNLY